MIILTIRTDKPQAKLGLYRDHEQLVAFEWLANRQLAETLHQKIEQVLQQKDLTYQNLDAVIIYKGPGSFTGLRIGMSVANALAASLNLSIVATSGKDWITDGINVLLDGANEKIAIPEYGAPARTTTPKK